jgi:hypothetical protein
MHSSRLPHKSRHRLFIVCRAGHLDCSLRDVERDLGVR